MMNHLKEAFMVLLVLVLVFGFVGCESAGKAFTAPARQYEPMTKAYNIDTPFHEAVQPKLRAPMIVVNSRADAYHIISSIEIANCFRNKTGTTMNPTYLHTEVGMDDLKNTNTVIFPHRTKQGSFFYLVKDTNIQYNELKECVQRIASNRMYDARELDYSYYKTKQWEDTFID